MVSRLIAAAAAVASVTGCATLVDSPHTNNKMADLWQPAGSVKGACASLLPQGTLVSSRTFVRACAQIAPHDAKSYLVTALYEDGVEGASADPGNWQIEVWSPAGKSVLVVRPEHRAAAIDECVRSVCNRRSVETTAMPVEWQPGRWRLRYTYLKDPGIVADMSIYLYAGPQ